MPARLIKRLNVPNADKVADVITAPAQRCHKASSKRLTANTGAAFNSTSAPAVEIKVSKILLTAEPISQNDTITYELTIENLGPQSASSVEFGDIFRKNMQLTNDGCNTVEEFDSVDVHMIKTVIPLLEVGQLITCAMTFLVESAAGTELVNNALVADKSYSNVDFNKSNNLFTIKTMVH